jgi:two-component system, OmpR family, KDP operon response regulator KdpE
MTTAMHAALIVEDDSDVRAKLRLLFETNGFRVRIAETAVNGLQAARVQRPDVVIASLELGDMDGALFVRNLRTWSGVPLVVLSPATAESQRLEAFELGADECIIQPFSAPEFLARVRAILRRYVRTQSGAVRLMIGPVSIDLERRTARYFDGREVRFTPLEHRILEILAHRPDRVVMVETLLGRVWGSRQQDPRSLRVCIHNLRQKLGEEPGRPRHLITEVGIGYRLVTECVESDPTASAGISRSATISLLAPTVIASTRL